MKIAWENTYVYGQTLVNFNADLREMGYPRCRKAKMGYGINISNHYGRTPKVENALKKRIKEYRDC